MKPELTPDQLKVSKRFAKIRAEIALDNDDGTLLGKLGRLARYGKGVIKVAINAARGADLDEAVKRTPAEIKRQLKDAQ